MVLRTFTNGAGTGLWSAAGNWDTGVPVDTDTFFIPVGLTCDFDVDQSAMATGMGASIINGELRALAGGARYLKMNGHLTGSGVLRAGTSEAVPFAGGSSFTIWRGALIDVNMSGALQLFATHPTNRYVRLSAGVILGATIMPVDTDVTSDAWFVGDIVAICNVNNGYAQGEYTIQAIAANQITLTGGVTTAFVAGSYMILCNRNVKITGAGVATAGQVAAGASSIISCEIAYGWYGLRGGGTANRFSGVIHGCYYPILSGQRPQIINACITRTAGGGAMLVDAFAPYIESTLLGGGDTGLVARQAVAENTIFAGIAAAIRRSSVTLINCSMIGNGADLYYESGQEITVQAYNTTWTSPVTANRSAATCGQWNDVWSLNHNGTPNAYRGWPGPVAGNTVTSQAVTVPPGYTQADQLALASAMLPTYRQWGLAIQPGEQIEVTAQLRKDVLMAYRPRIQVIDQAADPLVDGVSAALAETIMTDSVDTWETLTATWANSGVTERRIYVRVLGMNATGNAYAVVEWEVMMGTVATNVSTLLTRLTETRAGYLDNLSAGVTATATNISDAQSAIEDAIAEIPTVTPPTVEEIRTEMDANSTQLAAIVEDTGTTLPAAIAGLNDLSAAEVNAEVDTALSDYDGPTKAEMDAAHALLATAAALGIVDALVDAIKAKTDLITTNTAISVNSALSAGALTVYAGETLTTTFTGLTIPSNWKYIDLALKNVAMDTDAQSIVWIRATNPAAGTDGLQRLNGAAGTAAQGSLTVNQSAGTVAAWLADDATTQLTATTCIYGLKVIESDGDSSRLCADGTCTINNMVVKALT